VALDIQYHEFLDRRSVGEIDFMSRNVKDYDVRRDEILQVAQRLFYSQGYESTSVQNIIDIVGIAKGTFYHYFNSKQHLLEELIAIMVEAIMNTLETMIADQNMDAIQKLNRFFSDSQAVKFEKLQVVHTLLQVLSNDENTFLREKLKVESIKKVPPLLSRIIKQGKEDGSFTCEFPNEFAEIIMYISQGFSENLVQLILEKNTDSQLYELVLRKTVTYERAIEQLLNASPGSIHILSPDQIKKWLAISMIQNLDLEEFE